MGFRDYGTRRSGQGSGVFVCGSDGTGCVSGEQRLPTPLFPQRAHYISENKGGFEFFHAISVKGPLV
jgi:hypothetical protein